MKRLVIFGLLGPPVGFVVVFWVMLPLLNMALGDTDTFEFRDIVLLPASYAVGIVPALVVAAFDHVVRNVRSRILWTTLFAYGAAFIPLLGAWMMDFIQLALVLLLLFGLGLARCRERFAPGWRETLSEPEALNDRAIPREANRRPGLGFWPTLTLETPWGWM